MQNGRVDLSFFSATAARLDAARLSRCNVLWRN